MPFLGWLGASKERRFVIQRELGHALMALGRYSEAKTSYKACEEYLKDCADAPPASLLKLYQIFNLAEAERRASRTWHADEWEKIADTFRQIYKSSPTIPGQPSDQAKTFQAMHIAFAATRDFGDARDFLRLAERAAECC